MLIPYCCSNKIPEIHIDYSTILEVRNPKWISLSVPTRSHSPSTQVCTLFLVGRTPFLTFLFGPARMSLLVPPCCTAPQPPSNPVSLPTWPYPLEPQGDGYGHSSWRIRKAKDVGQGWRWTLDLGLVLGKLFVASLHSDNQEVLQTAEKTLGCSHDE